MAHPPDDRARTTPEELVPVLRPAPRDVVEPAVPVMPNASRPSSVPPIIARTVNICVNCVQGVGRAVHGPFRRRYHRHYHPKHRHGRKHLIADLAMLAGILALLAVNVALFARLPIVTWSRAQLAWTILPPEVRVGAAVAATLSYTYDGAVPLTNVTVAWALPSDGLEVISASPGTFDGATRTLHLGAIAPGASGHITMQFVPLAPTGTALPFRVRWFGTGERGNEQATIVGTLTMRGVAVDIDDVDVPPLIPAGGEATVVVRPHVFLADSARSSLALRVDAAAPLLIEEVAPDVTSAPAWDRPRTLHLHAPSAGVFPIRMELVRRLGDAVIPLGSVTVPVAVTAVPISVRVERREEAPSAAVLPGATLPLRVRYVLPPNVGSGPVPSLGLDIAGGLATIAPLGLTTPGARVVTMRGVEWALPTTSATGERSVTVRIPAWIDGGARADEASYVMTPVMVLAGPPLVWTDPHPTTPASWVRGAAFTIPVSSRVRAVSTARYFTPEGEQLGRGPLPPRVGVATKYWVTWSVTSVFRDADRVVMTAILPPNVAWTGRVSVEAGDAPDFDSTSRTVRWRAGVVSVGDTPATASFEVALTPLAAEARNAAVLLGESRVEATDSLGTALRGSTPPVTTELPMDSHARGKGIVVDASSR